VEAEVQGASQIAQDKLHHGKVRLLGIKHTTAYLMNDVGDVGVSECQVLDGTSKAPKLCRISNRRPRSGIDLGLRVHMR
jgi:hypothetical protein